jgi:16S rRNA (cytosine1402-N4)-methyltransferase
VLYAEAIEFLRVRAGGTVVDCTVGLAGHAAGIARLLGPKGHLIGFDRDPEALELAKARLDLVCEELGSQAPKVTLIDEAFSTIARHVEPASVDGLLADFGMSSLQLEARRGFSFSADGLLDMRMDTRSGPTAAQVVSELSERELADLIYTFGEERRSRNYKHIRVSKDRRFNRPGNEKRSNSPCNQDISGTSYLCKSRVGRDTCAIGGRT